MLTKQTLCLIKHTGWQSPGDLCSECKLHNSRICDALTIVDFTVAFCVAMILRFARRFESTVFMLKTLHFNSFDYSASGIP